jgi:hypothetical protein
MISQWVGVEVLHQDPVELGIVVVLFGLEGVEAGKDFRQELAA